MEKGTSQVPELDPGVQFVKLTEVEPFDVAPGARARPLFGTGAMFNMIDLDPGAIVALHQHPHEQLGLILSGELILTVEGVERRLGPNDAYRLPGGVEHSGRAGDEGCRVLDVFQPVREDYRERWAGAGR